MFCRSVNILKSNSFFLFGARGTGKTYLLGQLFTPKEAVWIDLLDGQSELLYAEDPDSLSGLIDKMSEEWVVVDEVQKVPKLLDIVHREIERRKIKFALTGSSARKLKRGSANMLAGRAFVYNLFPLTHAELDDEFDLDAALQWGTLPKIFDFSEQEEKKLFLSSYVETYLKEEIFAEQLSRNIIPFRRFLKLAAQSNGTVLNYNKISQDIGIDSKTVRNYFDILEDTLLGFYLPATEKSFRKQQHKAPKFYLFDCGVKREIEGVSDLPPQSAQEKGVMFEHWLITEIYRLNSYNRNKYELSFLLTKGGLEIDLVLDRVREEPIFIEIKSTKKVTERHLKGLLSIKKDHESCRFICICDEQHPRLHEGIEILPWKYALKELNLIHTHETPDVSGF